MGPPSAAGCSPCLTESALTEPLRMQRRRLHHARARARSGSAPQRAQSSPPLPCRGGAVMRGGAGAVDVTMCDSEATRVLCARPWRRRQARLYAMPRLLTAAALGAVVAARRITQQRGMLLAIVATAPRSACASASAMRVGQSTPHSSVPSAMRTLIWLWLIFAAAMRLQSFLCAAHTARWHSRVQ